MQTMLLDVSTWDLVVDIDGNVAVASDPYSQAQDAASAIRTFQGEVYYDTSLGVPYWPKVLGLAPSLAELKNLFNVAALAVPDVVTAQSFINAIGNDRTVRGQVQTTNSSGQTGAAFF
jgi:hypothetical protein